MIAQQLGDDVKYTKTGLITHIHFCVSWCGDIPNFDALAGG
jgi:hypothetical protein